MAAEKEHRRLQKQRLAAVAAVEVQQLVHQEAAWVVLVPTEAAAEQKTSRLRPDRWRLTS